MPAPDFFSTGRFLLLELTSERHRTEAAPESLRREFTRSAPRPAEVELMSEEGE